MIMVPIYITITLALFLGLVSGVIMHRSDFCMTAAFRDLFLFRSTTMLAALLLLVTVSSVIFESLRLMGGGCSALLFGTPTLVTVIAAGIFGVGMVLAGGCVVGTLYHLGAGSRLALWGLVGMIVGSALYAEIHPFWSSVKRMTTLSPQAMTLPQLSGLPPWFCILILVVGTSILFWRRPQDFMPVSGWREMDGYIPPLYAALILAGVGALSVFIFNKPMGVTTSYVKVAAIFEQLLIPDHFAQTAFFHTQSTPVTLPFSTGTLPTGPGPSFDGIAVIQYPLIFGIILGSAVSAWRLGELRWSAKVNWRQTGSVILGGVLMGLASRMASGCNIWYLWGGLPIFSVQSVLFVLGLIPGAWIGSKLLIHWVLPEKFKELGNE